MTNLNISLPDAMKAFVETVVAEGQYSTPSEFIRQLIRDYQQRTASSRESRLLAALVSGEAIEDDAALEALRQKLRARIDQQLLAALDRPAVDGEAAVAALQKKNRGRRRSA